MTWSIERDGSLVLLRIEAPVHSWAQVFAAVDEALALRPSAVAVPKSLAAGTPRDRTMLMALSRHVNDRGVGVMWTASSGSYGSEPNGSRDDDADNPGRRGVHA